MTVLNEADKIYIGSTLADKVYAGTTQVWPAAGLPAVPTSGLIARWNLGDGSGTDLSGAGNHGIFHGGAAPTTVGPVGNAVVLDGVNDYVVNDKVLNLPYVSMAFWLKGATPGVAFTYQFFCGFAEAIGSGTTDKYITAYGDSGVLFQIYIGGVGAKTLISPIVVLDGLWHHVVGTYEEGMQRLYIDGVLNQQQVATGGSYAGYSAPNVFLGGTNNVGVWCPGTFDDFLLYNRALTAAEVTSIYNGGSP